VKVTYEFCAFPAWYCPQDRCRSNKGWRTGVWSAFSFATLAEAKAEIRRLARAYVVSGAYRLEGIAKSANIFEITKVTREKIVSLGEVEKKPRRRLTRN
jgi:hypothetical protein